MRQRQVAHHDSTDEMTCAAGARGTPDQLLPLPLPFRRAVQQAATPVEDCHMVHRRASGHTYRRAECHNCDAVRAKSALRASMPALWHTLRCIRPCMQVSQTWTNLPQANFRRSHTSESAARRGACNPGPDTRIARESRGLSPRTRLPAPSQGESRRPQCRMPDSGAERAANRRVRLGVHEVMLLMRSRYFDNSRRWLLAL